MSKPNALAGLIALEACLFVVIASAWSGLPAFLAAWAALACSVVSLAYLANWPGVYGKRDGRLRPIRVLPVLPYLAGFWVMCALVRWWRRANVIDEVAPGVYAGGRLRAGDLPAETARIVDLTCEFSEPAELRHHPGYRCFPVLDGGVPKDERAFERVLDEVGDAAGAVIFHCDAGRGRAPTAAALGLLWRGFELDVDSACRRVAQARPVTSFSGSDRAFIERMLRRRNAA